MARSRQCSIMVVLLGVSICLGTHAAEDDLDTARKHKAVAVTHLRKADEPEANRVKELKAAEASLVEAQGILSAFEEPVPPEVETELAEINSLIYWTRKMMPLDSGERPRPVSRREPPKREEPRSRPQPGTSPAKRHFEAAQRYAEEHPDQHFLVAVKYFEVASRFAGTTWSIKAQRLALAYQRKALAAARRGKSMETARAVPETRKTTEARADAKPLIIKPVASEYERLKQVLRENTSRARKIEVCKAYIDRSPEGRGSSEIRAVAGALAAESGASGTLTWIDYLVAYPQGLMTGRALDALRRSEDVAFAEIARSLAADDLDRALRISRACLRALPGRSWGGEIKSLMAVLKRRPGQARTRLAREHVRRHSSGELARMLAEIADGWERADELDAFDLLRRRFHETTSRGERGAAVREFLDSYPDGVRSTEVEILALAVTLDNPRKRLENARRYLDDYPEGVFQDSVRALVADFVEEVDEGLFAETMKRARNRGLAYKDRLAATERYLDEFPDGDRARQVRAAAQQVQTLIADEARAYDGLISALKRADTEGGLRACSDFLARHAGGAHGPEVTALRDDYRSRLSTENEAEAYEAVIAGIAKPSLTRVGKAEALVGFLGSFGQGRHGKDVRARLRKLAPGRLGSLAGPVRAAAFSADSTTLVTADADASRAGTGIWIWSVPEGKLVARYQASSGFSACSVAFGPGDREIWVGETSGGLIAWEVSSGRVLGRYRVGGGPVAATAPVGNGAIAVTASLGDAKLRLWTSGDWSLRDSIRCSGGVASVAASPSGDAVAVGQRDGSIVCLQGASLTALWTEPRAHARAIGHICFSPEGSYVASCSPDAGTVSLRDARTGKVLWEVSDRTPTVAFSGRAGVLTSEGVRSIASGGLLAKFGGSGPVAVSPDGKFALITDGKGGGTLWYMPALFH